MQCIDVIKMLPHVRRRVCVLIHVPLFVIQPRVSI